MKEMLSLIEVGFSEAEAKVYVALLESGLSLVGPLITKTGLHRSTTYQVLNRLKEKGFAASIVKGKKTFFEAVNPQRIFDLEKERESKLAELLPLLKSKYRSSAEPQSVVVFSGVKGIKTVLDNVLNELNPGGIYYDFGVSGLLKEVVGPYWYVWQKKKKQYDIHAKVIFNQGLKKTNPLALKEYFGKARFHPEEYASLTDTMIYNDTVILLIWTANPPLAIVIQNKENAKSYLNQFKLLWRVSVK